MNYKEFDKFSNKIELLDVREGLLGYCLEYVDKKFTLESYVIRGSHKHMINKLSIDDNTNKEEYQLAYAMLIADLINAGYSVVERKEK